MKKILFISIILILSAVYFTLSNKEKDQEGNRPAVKDAALPAPVLKIQKEARPAAARPVAAKKKAPQRTMRPARKSKEHPQTTLYKKMKEERMVNAELVDGKAIAYGDVIIGEVEPVYGGKLPKRANFELREMALWESNRIRYHIDKGLKNEAEVKKAIEIINKTTVMEFVPFESHGQDGIVFKQGKKNCYSYLGKIGGAQPIMLAPECGVTEVLHEILHALGFIHEQSRGDRDNYLEIIWDNILPEYFTQFQMVPDDYMVSVEGSDFDFTSIMIYRDTSFAREKGLKTMKAFGNDVISPSTGKLSKIDIERIYRLYAP